MSFELYFAEFVKLAMLCLKQTAKAISNLSYSRLFAFIRGSFQAVKNREWTRINANKRE